MPGSEVQGRCAGCEAADGGGGGYAGRRLPGPPHPASVRGHAAGASGVPLCTMPI